MNFSFLTSLNLLITIGLYALLMVTLWLLFGNSIIGTFGKKQHKNRFKVKPKVEVNRDPLYEHINSLLSITLGLNSSFAVRTFYFLTVTLFVLATFILKRQSSLAFNLLFSTAFSLLPYFFLRLRLRVYRVEGSYEGELVIAELLNQYKINYYNIVEAIDKSIQFLQHAPYSRKILVRLAMRLKDYKSESELISILNEFIFAIDTEWIRMLSNNIYLAIEDGIEIAVSLDDILKELRQAKIAHEQSIRVNTEGFAIIKYLVPAMYIGSIYTAVKYFDFTVAKFFDYQLNTATGFRFFVIVLGLFIVNVSVMVVFNKRKFDF